MKDKAFNLIRDLPILETHSAHFLKVLEFGPVSTNVYLRRIHNFALDMNWLPWSILPKTAMAESEVQRKTRHHVGRISAHYCRRGESRT